MCRATRDGRITSSSAGTRWYAASIRWPLASRVNPSEIPGTLQRKSHSE